MPIYRKDIESRIENETGKAFPDYLRELYETKSIRQIAKHLKVNERTVTNWFRDYNIKPLNPSASIAKQWVNNDERKQKQASWMSRIASALTGEKNNSKRADVREKISESKKGERNAMYGKFAEQNPNWRGGKMTAHGAAWESAKRQAHRRDGYKCVKCNSTKQLEVHHIIPYRYTQDNRLENLITLCHKCHANEERKSLTYGAHKRKIKQLRFW